MIWNKKNAVYVASADRTQSKIQHKGIWARLFHTCKTARLPWWSLLMYAILYILEGIILVNIPAASANFFAGDASVKSISTFIGLELLSTVVCQFVLYYNHVVRYKMNRNLRNALWGKILRLKPSYYDRVSSGTLLSRITIDADGMNELIMDVMLEIVFQIYILVLTIGEMSKVSIRAGLMLLAFFPVTFAVTFLVGRLNLKFENSRAYKCSNLTNYLSELVSCMPLLKSMNMQGYERRRGKQVVDEYYRENRNIVAFDVLKQIIGTVVGIGPQIVIILMGIRMLGDGTVDAAGWYMFYLYAGTFIGFCSTMGSMFEKAKTAQGKLNKISDVLYEEEESLTGYITDIVESGDIAFDRVSFAYEEEPVLKDASFEIPAKGSTVIIGRSGSGKSTILKLLERIYEPTQGRILKNGGNISDVSIQAWRESIAFVTQNTPLMSGTIRENITYGISRQVSDEEIMEAAAFANIDGFIRENPEGLQYQVGQFGEKLSGGQRQKLSVARAILTGAPTLIMDEPTASLDIPSAQEIAQTVQALKRERMIITVTHDARLLKGADHIIAVSPEHRVTQGDHKQMHLMSDIYNQLMAKEN